jgi:hypothetical protein
MSKTTRDAIDDSYFPIEIEYIYSGERAVVNSHDEIRDEAFRIVQTRCRSEMAIPIGFTAAGAKS